jgi:hypothetical protein
MEDTGDDWTQDRSFDQATSGTSMDIRFAWWMDWICIWIWIIQSTRVPSQKTLSPTEELVGAYCILCVVCSRITTIPMPKREGASVVIIESVSPRWDFFQY